jgi:TfoX/Sxy family transcriptional regulator of competence genes
MAGSRVQQQLSFQQQEFVRKPPTNNSCRKNILFRTISLCSEEWGHNHSLLKIVSARALDTQQAHA